MAKVLRVTRIALDTYNPAGPVVVIPLDCWRYTLTIFQPTPRNTTINGQKIPDQLNTPFAIGVSATYVERVGGHPGQENNVQEVLAIVYDPLDVAIAGVIVIETWQDA